MTVSIKEQQRAQTPRTDGRQSGEKSFELPNFDLTLMSSAISLHRNRFRRSHFRGSRRGEGDALLQRAALIAQLADLGEEDADLVRERLAEVVDVSGWMALRQRVGDEIVGVGGR